MPIQILVLYRVGGPLLVMQYAYIEIELIEMPIPVDLSLDNLNLCSSKCAISSIKYIMRNPHITNISANGTLQDKIKKKDF